MSSALTRRGGQCCTTAMSLSLPFQVYCRIRAHSGMVCRLLFWMSGGLGFACLRTRIRADGPPACSQIDLLSHTCSHVWLTQRQEGPSGATWPAVGPPIAVERRPPHAARGSCHPPGCFPCRWACLYGACKRTAIKGAQPTGQISAWGRPDETGGLPNAGAPAPRFIRCPRVPHLVAPTGQAASGQLGEPCSPRRTAEPVRLAARYERHRCNPY